MPASHPARLLQKPVPKSTGEARPGSTLCDQPIDRPRVEGKFLSLSGRKFLIRGVSYGAFRPDEQDREYRDDAAIDRDFRLMAEAGINTVRIPHTMPPRRLLDIAARHGLMVMVGLSAEQHVGYLIDTEKMPRDLDERIASKVREVAGHPALLCYALGNEIPAAVARWIGRARIEKFLLRLCSVVRKEDPAGLVTYVNYPSTEYLDLSFLDFVSFNVYLEKDDALRSYLARLHSLAGSRPLVMSEIGLDALRNGEVQQAEVLARQIDIIFRAGCAGGIIFSWTDEWFRGGAEVDDWAFGLTRRDRTPKPALAAVSEAYAPDRLVALDPAPFISVVICTCNGASTLRECLEHTLAVDYPSYEVIVVDDGSKDASAEIASSFGDRIRLASTENRGLSSARNTGLEMARGEIVAYLDDDAYPDSLWLRFLGDAFVSSGHTCIGGPNLPPIGDSHVAQCVANAPGGPLHVLIDDEHAEHVPGCNMAFRADDLRALGGFDPQFRVAGDDVDICWRVLDQGWTIGFHPAAVVWHHRRAAIRRFLRQQAGYGKAEALLEAKWPAKYNSARHIRWAGRVYGNGLTQMIGSVSRVYYGPWGMAPFQMARHDPPPALSCLLAMPEWWLVLGALAALSIAGLFWTPLLLGAGALLAVALLLTLVQIAASVRRTEYFIRGRDRLPQKARNLALISFLHLVQPLARLCGRIRNGRSLWPRTEPATITRVPRPRRTAVFTERWIDPWQRLSALEGALARQRFRVSRGGDFDRWDIQLDGGITGGARLLMAIEDQGSGTQYVRVRSWPILRPLTIVLTLALFAGGIGAGLDGDLGIAALLAAAGCLVASRAWRDAGRAQAKLLELIEASQ